MRYDALSSRVPSVLHVSALRTLLLLLTLALPFAVTACGDDSGNHHDDEDASLDAGDQGDGGNVVHTDSSTPPRRDGGSDASADAAADLDATNPDAASTDDAGDAASNGDAALDDAATGDAATHTLTTIQVTPATPTVAKGTTQQFKATGLYADNTSEDLTAQVTWSVSDTTLASITAAGLLTALQPGGPLTVSAALNGIMGTTTATVSPVTLSSLAVTPFTASLAPAISLQFTVTGTFSDTTTQDLTAVATWSSQDPTVATVDAHGLVTAIAKGNTTIIATVMGQMGNATLAVTDAVLDSIAINAVTASPAAGSSTQLTAVGTFSDTSTQDLTKQVHWASSNETFLTVSNAVGTEGRATALAAGPLNVTATLGSVTGTLALTVSPATLNSIAITPNNASFAAGTTQPFVATGSYSDGSTQNLTDVAVWSVDDATVASVSNSAADRGTVTGIKAAGTTLHAAVGAVSGSTPITVTPATLVSLAVTPTLPSIPAGTTKQFTATGTYTDNSTQDVTSQVTWSSETPSIAAISNTAGSQGVASGLTPGPTKITATLGATSANTTLTVSNATLVTITITPVNPTLARGTSQQFTATGVYTDNSTVDLTATVAWSSSDATAATVGSGGATAGLVAAVGAANGIDQLVLISASQAGVTGSTTVHVTPATLTSITVTPANGALPRNAFQQYVATGSFSDSTTQDITASVTWSSMDTNVATISNAARDRGLLTTNAAGPTVVIATRNGVTGMTNLTVNNVNLKSIAVTPVGASIAKGTTLQFQAIATYEDNSTLDVTSRATWVSTMPTFALVSNAAGSKGLVTGVGGGMTNIRATYQGQEAAQPLNVTAAKLTSITVTPANGTIALGHAQQYTATGNYDNSTTQDLTTQVTWLSTNTTIAVVSNTTGSVGLVSAVKAGGPITIRATGPGGIRGETTATVQ